MRIKAAIVIIAICAWRTACWGQDLPKIIPPSPAAMQFQKYGDYPVGYYTGVPDISIPLYTVKEGDLELPITLSYHASGVKVNDISGFVGLGWVLNIGGLVSRTINDKPDYDAAMSLPATPAGAIPYTTPSMLQQLKVTEETYDTQYDEFSYNFLSESGKFVLKGPEHGTPVLFPYKPLQVTPITSTYHIDGFDIKDLNGVDYRFGASTVSGEGAVELVDYGFNQRAISSWFLTDMMSGRNPANKIHVKYVYNPVYHGTIGTPSYVLDDAYDPETWPCQCPNSNNCCDGGWCMTENYLLYASLNGLNLQENASPISYDVLVPQEIQFSNGKIEFLINPTSKTLASLEVYDLSNTLIKKINFDITPFGGTSPRYKLGAIHIMDKNSTLVNSYSFNYFEEAGAESVPNPGSTAAIDFWGFYNGHAENVNTIPRWPNWMRQEGNNFPVSGPVGYANRNSMDDYGSFKSYTLSKIIYPTGGYTLFDYEAHHVNNLTVGGLRVKNITNYTSDGQQSGIKRYEYGTPIMDVVPDISLYSFTQKGLLAQDAVDIATGPSTMHYTPFRRTYFTDNPYISLAPKGSPVVYLSVTEKFEDDQHHMGANFYSYDNEPLQYTEFANNVYTSFPEIQNKKFLNYFRPWSFGNLVSKTTSRFVNGGYEGVTSEENEYEEIIRDTVRDFKIERYCFPYTSPVCTASNLNPADLIGQTLFVSSIFNFADHFIISGEKRLKRTTSSYFSGNNPPWLSTVKEYIYDDNVHDQPTKIITTNSKEEEIQTEYKYPVDFKSATTPNVYNDMADRHIWAPPVQQSTYNSNLFLQSTLTNYNYWYNNAWGTVDVNSIIVPQTVEVKKQANPSETRLRFDAYDAKGNTLSVFKENGVRQAYIWDYNQSEPTAQVINASVDNIAATSFESDGKGNFTYSGTAVTDVTAPTGKKIYNLWSGQVTKAVNSTITYVVSLWSAGTGVTVNGNPPVKTGRSIGPYTYYEYRVTNASLVTIGGSTNIDELRLYPEHALMTTYTYQPLIGATTQCDANNRVSYFEYDAAGRLQHIRDQDRNILKRFCYNYLGQSVDCGMDASGAASWQATGITRCVKCPSNTNANTGVIESKETDNNPSSPTYTQLRWVYAGTGSACPITGGWQNTSTPPRCQTIGGQNTGEQEQEQNYISPCGDISSTRWLATGTNTTACPIPSVFTSIDYSGTYQRVDCILPAVSTSVYVSIPAGMFTSAISVADANAQAAAYANAQAIANTTCEFPPFTLVFNNQATDNFAYDVELTNSDNVVVYTFHPNGSGSQDLGTIAPGIYNVHISPAGGSSVHTYEAGCTYSVTGSDEWLSNVPINPSCNTINVYP